MRSIYKSEGIKIDLREIKGTRIRAAYFCEDGRFSVLVNKKLPQAPRLFCLAHELKHHYLDRDKIRDGTIKCGDYNQNKEIEIAAEIFAAEFIYPVAEMVELIQDMGINKSNCTPEELVKFKKKCPAKVSYQFLVKRFEWLRLCQKGEYKSIQFNKLEEKIYGKPFYKEKWFKEHRAKKSSHSK